MDNSTNPLGAKCGGESEVVVFSPESSMFSKCFVFLLLPSPLSLTPTVTHDSSHSALAPPPGLPPLSAQHGRDGKSRGVMDNVETNGDGGWLKEGKATPTQLARKMGARGDVAVSRFDEAGLIIVGVNSFLYNTRVSRFFSLFLPVSFTRDYLSPGR